MKRRDFLRSSSMAAMGGLALRASGNPLMDALSRSIADDRVLVIIQLIGGNDGLNTVIPLDDYALMTQFRPHVLIPQSSVLALNGTTTTGLHPSMSGMRNMYNNGKLAIVQGVGYPQPNLSHFRATDIYETGANSTQLLQSGWAGRYLNHAFPNYPAGFPNDTMPDPLAIRVGGIVNPGLQYMGQSMGVPIFNTNDPLNLTGNRFIDPVTADCKGSKAARIRTVQRQADVYGDAVQAAAVPGCNLSTMYPTGNQPGATLAQQLKIVAQLICGGLKTKIYWVGVSGFDTHAQQVEQANHLLGTHANLLQGVSNSIAAFQNDLQLLGLEDRVLGMTFSEFGRRIVSNASLGTDHGTSQPMFLFGTNVIPGILGSNPDIPTNSTYFTNLAMQYDYRSVYAAVLKDWFCLSQGEVESVLLGPHQPLNLIDPGGCLSTSLQEANQQAGENLINAYPNPFTERTNLQFTTYGGQVTVQVFNEQGQLVRTVLNRSLPAGVHNADVDLGEFATGVYYARLQNESRQQVRNLLKVR